MYQSSGSFFFFKVIKAALNQTINNPVTEVPPRAQILLNLRRRRVFKTLRDGFKNVEQAESVGVTHH